MNRKNEGDCSARPKCLWSNGKCAGKQIHAFCKKPLSINGERMSAGELAFTIKQEQCLSKWESQFKMWITQQMLEPLAVLGTWAAILSAKGTLQKCCIGAKVVGASLSSDRMPQATFQGKPLVKNSQSSVEAIMDLKKAVAVLQKHHRRQHHRCPV